MCRACRDAVAVRRHREPLAPPLLSVELLPMLAPLDGGADDRGWANVALRLASAWAASLDLATQEMTAMERAKAALPAKEQPLAQCDFWHHRAAYLRTLLAPLEGPEGKRVLDRFKSGDFAPHLMGAGGEGGGKGGQEAAAAVAARVLRRWSALRVLRRDAEWGGKYLEVLRKPFRTLADGKLEAAVLCLAPMVKTIRLLPLSSRTYKDAKAIEPLLASVGNAAAARAAAPLEICAMLAEVQRPRQQPANSARVAKLLAQLIAKVDASAALLNRWREAAQNLDGSRQQPCVGMPGGSGMAAATAQLDEELLFGRTDFVATRCCELREVLSLLRHANTSMVKPRAAWEIGICCAELTAAPAPVHPIADQQPCHVRGRGCSVAAQPHRRSACQTLAVAARGRAWRRHV